MSSIHRFNDKVKRISKKYRQRENIYNEIIKTQCKDLRDRIQNLDVSNIQNKQPDPKISVIHLSLTCFSKDFEQLSERVQMQNLYNKVKTQIEKMQEQKSILKSQLTFFLSFLRRSIRCLQKNIN